MPRISEVSEAESNDPMVQSIEAEALDATGARFPAVCLSMVPRCPMVNMGALRLGGA